MRPMPGRVGSSDETSMSLVDRTSPSPCGMLHQIQEVLVLSSGSTFPDVTSPIAYDRHEMHDVKTCEFGASTCCQYTTGFQKIYSGARYVLRKCSWETNLS